MRLPARNRTQSFFFILSLLALVAPSWSAGKVKVGVELFPAGTFEAKSSDLVGFVKKSKGKYLASGIEIPVASLVTGIELRDKHLHKRLKAKKCPKIKVLKAVASKGKGKAIMNIACQKKEVSFKVKASKKIVKVSFSISLKSLGIKDVNYMGVGVEDKISIEASIPVKK